MGPGIYKYQQYSRLKSTARGEAMVKLGVVMMEDAAYGTNNVI
jgi:hypothetical protein